MAKRPIWFFMFGIGGQEFILILLIALIVLGPKKLPEMAKTIGKALGEFQRATDDFKKEIDISSQEKPAGPEPESVQEKGGREPVTEATPPLEQGHPSDEGGSPPEKDKTEEDPIACHAGEIEG
jgi:TatA/E family protein of Tat protein translocase